MSTAPQPRPRRTVRRWFLRIIVGAGVIAGLLWAYVAYDDWKAQRAWQEACAEAGRLDPGWRWDEILAAWPQLPDERNSFIRAHAVAQAVPRWQPRGQDQIIEEYWQSSPQYRPSAAVVAALRERIAAASESALADALLLADYPEGHLPRPNGPAVLANVATPFEHLNLVRGLLYPHFVLQVEAGDFDAALVALRAIVHTSRPLADCPNLLNNLLAVSIRSFAANGVELLLAQGEPPAAVLDAARRLLEPEAGRSVLLPAFRSERALFEDIQRAFDDGRLNQEDYTLERRWTGWLTIDSRINRLRGTNSFHREDYTAIVRYYTWAIERLKESPDRLIECADEWAAMREQMPCGAKSRPYESSFVRDVAVQEARFRSAVVALAAEQYRQANGRWPATLDEIVPAYLAVILNDPFTSQPLRLAHRPDGLVIYSVGDDRTDNGGDVLGGQHKGRDIGILLWDVSQRRQPSRITGDKLP